MSCHPARKHKARITNIPLPTWLPFTKIRGKSTRAQSFPPILLPSTFLLSIPCDAHTVRLHNSRTLTRAARPLIMLPGGCFLLQLPPEIPTIPFGFSLQTSSNSSWARRAQQCTDPASHLTRRSVADTRLTWDSAVWCSGGSHVRCSFCSSLIEEERWEIERLK